MNFKNLLNKKFGKLTVVSLDHLGKGGTFWLCECECGHHKVVRGSHLTAGDVKSCGCLRKEVLDSTTHGMSYSRLYSSWASIKKRCLLVTNKSYKSYGGRGITICDEWKESFEAFRDWALANGYDDTLTIDRIDNDGNYEPSNCRWVNAKTQARNRSTNTLITFNGETRCVSEWAEMKGMSNGALLERLRKGWSIERALTQKIRQLRKKVS